MAAWTAASELGLTWKAPFSTRETVPRETPATLATSSIVGPRRCARRAAPRDLGCTVAPSDTVPHLRPTGRLHHSAGSPLDKHDRSGDCERSRYEALPAGPEPHITRRPQMPSSRPPFPTSPVSPVSRRSVLTAAATGIALTAVSSGRAHALTAAP